MNPTLRKVLIISIVVVVIVVGIVLTLVFTGVFKKTSGSRAAKPYIVTDPIEISGRGVLYYYADKAFISIGAVFKDASATDLRFVSKKTGGEIDVETDAGGNFTITVNKGDVLEIRSYDYIKEQFVIAPYYTTELFNSRTAFDGTFTAPSVGSSYTLPRIYVLQANSNQTIDVPPCNTPGWHAPGNVDYTCS